MKLKIKKEKRILTSLNTRESTNFQVIWWRNLEDWEEKF